MDKQQRHKMLESVMWDYSITAGEMEELLDGKIDKAGHYTRKQLFAKMLTGLPWYTIIQVVPVEKNKLTAVVSRDEPKDVFDICVLSQNYRFNWVEVFNEAKNKSIINEIDVEQRIKSFPVLLFQKADWHIFPVDIDLLANAIVTIANDFLLGSDNSLGADKPSIKDAIVRNQQPDI